MAKRSWGASEYGSALDVNPYHTNKFLQDLLDSTVDAGNVVACRWGNMYEPVAQEASMRGTSLEPEGVDSEVDVTAVENK